MNRCSLCPNKRKPVPSIGPKPCRILLLGEGPSYEEDRRGEPFVGKTVIELNGTYLTILGLPRSEVHIFNASACSTSSYDNPSFAQAASCSAVHLGPLLTEVRPEIIVPMGAVACSIFPEIESLALQHGRAIRGKWGSWKGILFPMFHPSAGLRATGYMIAMMQDMEDLRKLLANLDLYGSLEESGVITDGWTPFPEDPYPVPNYQFIQNTRDLADYLETWNIDRGKYVMGEDTESLPLPGQLGGGPPFCLTFSHSPGTGRLIYVRDTHLIDAYRKMLYELLPLQLFHNYLHDSEVFDLLTLPTSPFLDTMVRAYNLCLGGGGDDEEEGESRAGRGSLSLKVLAYRHCSMRMSSFKDTVYPHSVPHLLTWLKRGREFFSPDQNREPVCTCGHKQSDHEARGKSWKRTGQCLGRHHNHLWTDGVMECPCKKWKKAETVKHPEDKVLNLLHRKIGTVVTAIEQEKVDKNGKPVDPWKRVREWPEYDQNTLVEVLGPPPLASIEHVPEKYLLDYAVRDSDAALRMFLFMRDLHPWIFFD